MSGLIFANLGKSISDVGQNIGRQGFQLELMRLDEEKQLRLDAIKRQRDIDFKKQEITEVAPLQAQADANRTGVVGAAETDVLANREVALRPEKIQTARETGLLQGEIERANLGAYADDPNARGGARAKAADSESSATRATAEATRFKLSQDRAVGDLRTQLSKTNDPEQRSVLEQQIKDLTTAGNRSYSDMVTAAGHYRMLAQNLRKDAESSLSDADRDDMLKRARYYEQEADAILQTTTSNRLGSKPKATSGPNSASANSAKASKPWERNWSRPGNAGDVVAP